MEIIENTAICMAGNEVPNREHREIDPAGNAGLDGLNNIDPVCYDLTCDPARAASSI